MEHIFMGIIEKSATVDGFEVPYNERSNFVVTSVLDIDRFHPMDDVLKNQGAS
jgi:hypothetical protein